jgi:Uma2 family endonuclease
LIDDDSYLCRTCNTPVRKRDNDYHTYADYLRWSRTSGDELINGTAYVREPSPTSAHQLIVGELYHQVKNGVKGTQWRAFVAPLDVRLPRSEEQDLDVDTVVQPDVFITRDPQKVDSRGLRGAPDWIVEVLSPGTARYDQKKKLAAYERAAVPEVWLIDPRARNVAIYQLSQGVYVQPRELKLEDRTAVSVAPEIVIDWGAVVAELQAMLNVS